MFGLGKLAERRRVETEEAGRAAEAALDALAADDPDAARKALRSAPKKVAFADIGWKLALASALADLADGKRKPGLAKLVEIVASLDDTSLGKDDKGYLRLFALYRAIEASKDGKPPAELRAHAENFRFDHTLVSSELKTRFPLKKTEAHAEAAPPPMSVPPEADEDDPF
ncbi:hypothetical protein DDZ18_04040 [Marinicauda salina]|uniref:Uncharacterized protein n=1 Tax=Marinicauda salina TaxID=2135793 RepID=A0A2U2BXN4_9PROT|nr:hypothetical protein [Marinicauda salina]PWE18771.1 hypothetical protein DDZ18_04040 [Marinicauda salina]